jgi:hypothetical protein
LRRRFSLTGESKLVDKDGRVLGTIVNLTLDLEDGIDLADPPAVGTTGVGLEVQEALDLGVSEDGGMEETKRADAADPSTQPDAAPKPGDGASEAEAQVWRYFLDAFPDHRFRSRDLTPPRQRTIRKAFKAVGCAKPGQETIEQTQTLLAAIAGLQSWRQRKPGDISLSVIFETNMRDGKNLTEKIEWWASVAPGGVSNVPSESDASINRRKIAVAEMFAYPDSTAHQERGREAIEWLRTNAGLEFTQDETGKLVWGRIA